MKHRLARRIRLTFAIGAALLVPMAVLPIIVLLSFRLSFYAVSATARMLPAPTSEMKLLLLVTAMAAMIDACILWICFPIYKAFLGRLLPPRDDRPAGDLADGLRPDDPA